MPELEIRLQPIEEISGDHWRPAFPAVGHLKKETAMPPVPLPDPAVDLDRDSTEQVLDACIEGVQQRRKGRKLNGVRRLGARLMQERLVDRQQELKLGLFDGDLILEIRPHAEGFPCF